jgi:hypothetical protein
MFRFLNVPIPTTEVTQSVPGGSANILGGHNIGHSKQKVSMYMFPIPDGFRGRAISLYNTLYTVQTSNTLCPHTGCTKCIDVDVGIFENVLY